MTLHIPLHDSTRVAVTHRRNALALATLFLAMLIVAPITPLHAQAKDAAKGLAPPQNLWAAQTSPTEVTLVWDTVPGATEYRIYASGAVSLGTVGRVLQPLRPVVRFVLDIRRFIISSPGMEIGLQLEAVDAKGRVSEKISFNQVVPAAKAAAAVRVPPPANVIATETAPGVITLTWDPVPGATAYALGRSVWPNGLGSLCALCPTHTTYVDSGVTQGVQHAYSVLAITPNGNSANARSNVVTPGGGTTASGPVATLPPKGATNPKAVLISPDSVELTWTPDPKATAYVIERSMNGGGFQVIATVAGLIMQYVDVILGSTEGNALYRIIASNPKGRSPAVAFNPITISGAKANARPTGVTSPASAVTSASSITLSWVPDPAATSYRIERSLSGRPFQLLTNLPGVVPSYVDAVSGLIKQNPKYRIFSVNAAGTSSAVAVP